jgi:DNA-binding transcriptional ArsR family regulator
VPHADLSAIFSALADPTRRAILARLSDGDAAVKDLSEPFDLSGPAITKHLKVLEHAGLISRSREGQQRPCRLEPRALAPAADWIDQYRQMWEATLDRLGSYLTSVGPTLARRAAPEAPPKTTARSKPARTPRGKRHGRRK